MGEQCAPKNTLAMLRAKGQAAGDIFTEAERIKNMDGEQRSYYEMQMSRLLGESTPKKSAFDVIKELEKKPDKNIVQKAAGAISDIVAEDSLYKRPSEALPKKFYNAVDKKLSAWEKSGGKVEDYKEKVGKPVKDLIGAIDKTLVSGTSKKDINTSLKQSFGIGLKDVKYAREWLQWVADGGHTQTSKNPFVRTINQVASSVSKFQANAQMVWTLGNGVDMLRPLSTYASSGPKGILSIAKGIGDLARATKGNPFKIMGQLPELKKAGAYGTQYMDRGTSSKLNPFEWSINAQKNLVYFVDKAHGGNGLSGIRDNLFDSKAWDRGVWDRSPDFKTALDLARYPINEARWYFKTASNALKGDGKSAVNLALYLGLKQALTGIKGNIPAPLYAGLKKDEKELIDKIDEQLPFDLIDKTTTALSGGKYKLDMGNYVQPLGGQMGARLSSITDTVNKTGRSVSRGVINLSQGKIPAAAFNLAAGAMALNTLTQWKDAGSILGPLNSATFQKMMETTADALAGEFSNGDEYTKEVLKDIFGTTVKAADK